MKIITEKTLVKIIEIYGLENFFKDLMKELKKDFARWQEFKKIPRPALHVSGGVLELMPICDNDYYSFKYVNCHPSNPDSGLMTVVATGQLCDVKTGYPLMYSEMTLLTALRTAATTAIATDLMARKESKVLAIVGTGAQSEFLVKALMLVRNIEEVRFYDIDPLAMNKFEENMREAGLKLVRCKNAEMAVLGADMIITCTASWQRSLVLRDSWIKSGVHINGVGGDSPGKTELERSILLRSKVVVEYFDQCVVEGEIQQLGREVAEKILYAELHELIKGSKVGREKEEEITLYDSVGIALEDYSALKLTYNLSQKYNLGDELDMFPMIKDPKNLISMLKS
jgi:ornithine cyclodeaminase